MSFNLNNILTYFKEDLALKNAKGGVLKTLIKANPYSGVLQLLYCKHLYLNNDIEFERQLEKCALVVVDRKKVYELIFQPVIQTKIGEYESSLISKKEDKVVSKSPLSLSKGETESVESNSESNLKTKSNIEETNKANKIIDELEENILAEAVNSSLQIDISNYSENIEDDLEEDEICLEKEIEERAFVNWFEKPKEKIKKKRKETKKSIIDDFLKTTVKSRKIRVDKKEEIFSPTNIAKMSLVANNEFVTETLANIYAKQGQIDKAIEIYKQLSLKNPEKKTFFASRIRFLKEKQKYNN